MRKKLIEISPLDFASANRGVTPKGKLRRPKGSVRGNSGKYLPAVADDVAPSLLETILNRRFIDSEGRHGVRRAQSFGAL